MEFESWRSLLGFAQNIHHSIPTLAQTENTAITHDCITLDFSRQRLNKEILESLIALAEEAQVAVKLRALFDGMKLNVSENKAALHSALRSTKPTLTVDGINVMPDIQAAKDQIRFIADSLRAKQWLGCSGEPITDIVNLGIGGSDLGPRLCLDSLKPFVSKVLNYHFISDADPDSYEDVISAINPKTTLFIVTSKSFTTKETLYNYNKLLKLYPDPESATAHLIAVTAHPQKAESLGFKTIVQIWDWVGGRFSFSSAVNLITAIAIGYDQFTQMLAGAASMDEHAQQDDYAQNIPVLLALFGIWNNNFLNIHTLLVLAYSKRLEYFVPYLQQLDMESNGKSLDIQGRAVNYATGPIVWGGLGNQAQHSYLQLLAQGTHRCAGEFLSLKTNEGEMINLIRDDKLKVLSEGVESMNNPNGYIPGKMPINHLILSEMSPYSLGSLVALYEHKIFIQSVIWNINPFDQPGVESAKKRSSVLAKAKEFALDSIPIA